MAVQAVPPGVIDAHHHVWDPAERTQPWLESDQALAPLRRRFGMDDLAPQARAAGVSATVVVQTVTEPGETPELLALAAAEPLVGAVVGWTDLTASSVAADLDALAALPGGAFLSGIRHPLLTEPDPDWLARPSVRRGLSAVAAAGMCFDLVLRPDQLPGAVIAAASLPALTFVLDHLGNVEPEPRVDAEWAAAFAALAARPNTVCKLSGILGVPAPEGELTGQARPGGKAGVAHLRPYFDLAVDCFGPDRLMFGSDWPVCTLTASYSSVVTAAVELTARLSEPERHAILAGTARRVYHLTRPAARHF